MSSASGLTLDLTTARRLAVEAQGLAGPRPPANRDGIMGVFQRIGRIQLDPTAAVAPSHQLVLWSRLGPYDLDDLEYLRSDAPRIIHYRAMLYPTSDYPLLAAQMRWFLRIEGRAGRVDRWMADNHALRDHILDELARDGPLPTEAFEDVSVSPWQSSGWTHARNVAQMLEFLAGTGEIVVAGRSGGSRLWDLTEQWLPADVPRQPLSDAAALRERVERVVRWHGVLGRREIDNWAVPRAIGPSPVEDLVAEGRLVGVTLLDAGGEPAPGGHFVHRDALPVIERVQRPGWQGRTTLLSPFDVLAKDRDRTAALFGFRYKLEMYVPVAVREFGYYVLPILHGDRLIGRVDPRMDRRARVLRLNGIWAEPGAPDDTETVEAIAGALRELATFLGAVDIDLVNPPPKPWRALRP